MITTFPAQKRLTTEKTDQFYRDCADAAIALIEYDDGSGLRASMEEKEINDMLANNELRQEDVERVVNPWKIQGYDFPLEMRNYPILKSKIDLLVGEEIKRRFDWKIVLRNSEAISDKQKMVRDRFFQVFTEMMRAKSISEEEFKKKMEELNKWRLYEIKDIRERMATEIMTYQYDYQRMKFKFNRGFENLCILGEEIYSVEFVENDVVFERENPRTFYTLRSSSVQDIEESDIMVSDGYYPLGKIIDAYHEHLTSAQISKLEDSYKMNRGADPAMTKALTIPPNYYQEAYGEDIEIISHKAITAFGGAFDEAGNIRRTRIVWRGLRKMGKLKYFEDGHEMYDLVDENYKPNEDLGEEVEWFWGTEWLQVVKIGEDIYIPLGAFPRIGTSVSNPSVCLAPFTGTCYTIGNNKAMSLMSYGRPYQYLFNAGMGRTEKLIITSHGNVAPMPVHLIPDGWEIDDWLYYFSFLNFFVYDAFKEGNKGAATGKLAGNMTAQAGQMNFSNAQEIQQNVMFLNMVKAQIDDLTGVSPQRQGQIEQRELVGNVERSVTQSSHITENLFAIHEYTKLKAMTLVLEATKYAWRNKVMKRQLVLSDMSSLILDFDGEMFASGEYGIFFSNTQADMELFARLTGLIETGLQTKMLKFSDAMSLFMSNSASQVRRKIEQSEQEAIENAQKQAEADQARFMEEMKARGISEDKANELRRYIAELQEETKRMALQQDDLDVEGEPDNLAEQQDYELRNKELDLKDKHHSEEMNQKDKDREANIRIKKDEIEVKRLAAKRKPAASNSK